MVVSPAHTAVEEAVPDYLACLELLAKLIESYEVKRDIWLALPFQACLDGQGIPLVL